VDILRDCRKSHTLLFLLKVALMISMGYVDLPPRN
jgi:hypothetical protein